MDYPIKEKKEEGLARARNLERGFERTLYVMSVLTRELEEQGVVPVVIGDAAVEFYTRDWYATGDIDLAIYKNKRDEFGEVMDGSGFKKEGRMWVREDLGLYIEIPGDKEDISEERLTEVTTSEGHAFVIGLEDIIFDRIQAAEHWESQSDREQAIRMGASFYEDIDWSYLRKKCEEALSAQMLEDVLEEIENARG